MCDVCPGQAGGKVGRVATAIRHPISPVCLLPRWRRRFAALSCPNSGPNRGSHRQCEVFSVCRRFAAMPSRVAWRRDPSAQRFRIEPGGGLILPYPIRLLLPCRDKTQKSAREFFSEEIKCLKNLARIRFVTSR